MTPGTAVQGSYLHELRALGDGLGVRDAWLLSAVHTFGVRDESACLVAWLPVIELAWIGGLTPAEKRRVLTLVRSGHPNLDSSAEQLLARWLVDRPPAALFRCARRILRTQFSELRPAERTAAIERLVGLCLDVASVSGGPVRIAQLSL